MNVTFRCPHCHEPRQAELNPAMRELSCSHCSAKWPIAGDAVTSNNVARCLVCPSTELFVRKDFSQPLGIAIVGFGIVVSSVFWYYRLPNDLRF